MRWARLMNGATVLSAATALSALAAPFAYVSNEGSASVSVRRLDHRMVSASSAPAKRPNSASDGVI